MPLTAQERTDMQTSLDGTAKLAELDRMAVANLDDRFLHVNASDGRGNPLPPNEKAALRAKTLAVFRSFPSAGHLRARINIDNPPFDGTNITLSADNDYTALEQAAIEGLAVRLADFNTGFSIPKHPVSALNTGDILGVGAYAEISNNTPGARQTGISDTYVKIDQFDTIGFSKNITISGANGNLTIARTGFYTVYYSLSWSGSASETYIVAVHVNDTEIVKSAIARKLSAGGDVGNGSSQCILRLDADDIVDLRIRTNTPGSSDFTLQTGNFIINKVR